MTGIETQSQTSRLVTLGRAFLFVFFIYLFLVAVKMFGASATIFTDQYQGIWTQIQQRLDNPFFGLFLGVFAAAVMQSSSATTSIAVTLVATGLVPLENAVTIVMGANIGRSITCMIVALGYVRQKKMFARAFPVSFIQDNFNILTVCVCFTLEMTCHFLSRTARWIVSFLPASSAATADGGAAASGWLWNPIPVMADFPVNLVKHFMHDVCHFWPTAQAILLGALGLFLLFFALKRITRTMTKITGNKVEVMINRVLSKSGWLTLFIGLIITMVVQSSAITISLMIPLAAAGVVKLRTYYPIILGACLGTTITAVIAAMAYMGTPVEGMANLGLEGLSIAVVHILFNLIGVLCFFPIPFLRIPMFTTEFFVPFLTRSRRYVFLWIALIFFILPGVGLWLLW